MNLNYDVQMKHCSRGDNCINPKGSFLPVSEFSVNNSNKSGYQDWCILCKNQYYQDNKEQVKQYYQDNKEQAKQYYQDNKEQISENQKQYRQDNKEQISKYGKQYRQDNNEQISKRNKQYHQENKEQINKRSLQNSQRLKVISPKIWNGSNNSLHLKNYLIKNLGIVYFIGDTNLTYVKIGLVTSVFNLSKRYQAIQGCCPLTLKLHGFIQTEKPQKIEKELHEKFKRYKKHPTVTNGHEWFFYTPEIVRYVEINCLKIELANTLLGESYIDLEAIF